MSAIEFEEEDDTPPIPPGELPAFAAPPNAPTGWSIDPETGEKVHLGPIELTFDGPVVPPPRTRVAGGRLALYGAAGLLVVAAAVAFFVVRGKGASGPEGGSPGNLAANAAGTGASPAGPPPTEPGAPAEEAAPDTAAPAPAAAGREPEKSATTEEPPAPIAPAQERPTTPPSAASPIPQAPPRTDPATAPHDVAPTAGRPAAPATTDFGFGQRLIDAGTLDRAAEAFKNALGPIPAGRFTLQMMIACEAESVRKARAGTRPDAGLFVLPVAVRGRGCYRVLWGVFETRAEAEAARGDLPKYFVSSGVSPAVVAIDRLRTPS